MQIINNEIIRFSLKKSAFDNTIFFDGNIENDAIKDLVSVLENYTGNVFKILPYPNNYVHGIHIQPRALGNRDGQSFNMRIDGLERAKIIYSDYAGQNNSLANAIYTFLEKLGIEWLTSNDNGLEIPFILNEVQFPATEITPVFLNRKEFGTGGLAGDIPGGSPLSFHNGENYQARWIKFYRRNRWNWDADVSGHAGQMFYQNNKDVCDAHPEWFVNEYGKQGGRIKIEYPEAVSLYKDWAYGLYTTQKNAGLAFISVGIDPEDGRGGSDDSLPPFDAGKNYATMPDGKKIYNFADKWWWLTNQVAELIPDNETNTTVSVQAYGDGNQNALAPNFDLDKNIYPNLNAWAFQTAYFPRHLMFEAWKEKLSGFASAYDYFNITQWSVGLPQMANFETVKDKHHIYKNNKVNGVIYETTDANSIASFFYVFSKYHFDDTKNWEVYYQNWLKKMFANGWLDMKIMFDRWQNNYQAAGDMGLSLDNINAAKNKVPKNSKWWRRIMDYAAYIHWCIMYYNNPSDMNLYTYMYRINHLMMLQTPAFIGQYYLPKPNPVPSHDLQPISYVEIENQLAQDIIDNPKVYDIFPFVLNVDRVTRTGTSPVPPIYGLICYAQIKPKKNNFTVRVLNNANVDINIVNDDGVIVSERIGSDNYSVTEIHSGSTFKGKDYTVNAIPGKTYTIKPNYEYNWTLIRVMGDDEILFANPAKNSFDAWNFPYHYIYCPLGCGEIVFYDENTEGTNGRGYIRNIDGVIIANRTEIATNIYKVLVQPSERGKCLIMDFGHSSWKILNLPNVAFFDPFNYQE